MNSPVQKVESYENKITMQIKAKKVIVKARLFLPCDGEY